jgi:hypothetical protein
MARISIPETCAGATITRQDGAALRKVIEHSWGDGEPLQLDFGGQRVASASFFDESLGLLVESLGVKTVLARISIIGIDPGDRALLNRIIQARVSRVTT